jgi:hypothetical protein
MTLPIKITIRVPRFLCSYLKLLSMHCQNWHRQCVSELDNFVGNSRRDRAEDYHPKYLLSAHSVLAGELAAIYPHKKEYVDATSVTRLNSYAGGYGTKAQLMREIDGLGLGPAGKRYLLNIVK